MTNSRSIRILFTNGIIVFVSFLVLVEIVSWSIGAEAKLTFVNQNGGVLSYFSSLVRNVILPEMATVFVLALLMNWGHNWVTIERIDTNWKTLILYQLSFLPVLLIAFMFFIPLTQSIRYLLTDLSGDYWHRYIIDSYSLAMYLRYLLPVIIVGYGALNLALVTENLERYPVTN